MLMERLTNLPQYDVYGDTTKIWLTSQKLPRIITPNLYKYVLET